MESDNMFGWFEFSKQFVSIPMLSLHNCFLHGVSFLRPGISAERVTTQCVGGMSFVYCLFCWISFILIDVDYLMLIAIS